MAATGATRRGMIAGGGMAALAMAMASEAPGAARRPMTAEETANLALVKAYIAAWSSGPFDPDAVLPRFFAADARTRLVDSAPWAEGPAATAASFRPYLVDGQRFTVEYLETFVRGPLVMTSRIDTEIVPGKPDRAWPVVGIFVVKGGLIHEWTDFVVA